MTAFSPGVKVMSTTGCRIKSNKINFIQKERSVCSVCYQGLQGSAEQHVFVILIFYRHSISRFLKWMQRRSQTWHRDFAKHRFVTRTNKKLEIVSCLFSFKVARRILSVCVQHENLCPKYDLEAPNILTWYCKNSLEPRGSLWLHLCARTLKVSAVAPNWGIRDKKLKLHAANDYPVTWTVAQ